MPDCEFPGCENGARWATYCIECRGATRGSLGVLGRLRYYLEARFR